MSPSAHISDDDKELLRKLDRMRDLAMSLERHLPDVAQGIVQACIAMSETIAFSNRSTAEGRFRRRIAANQMKMLLRDIALLSAKVTEHLSPGGDQATGPLHVNATAP
ncbi:hypothetical protein C2U72_27800 [Prosthecomicrobium hirschii]|uniref:hypothetical protein n=1 Tax=Prosthecodimorpha hirschii TaxID=665126 RepID=UPI00112BF14C|nr:hypothetical protein [Prosthecomicrobium hirschii]TPQ44424.1 hypothetical protein C2U72_27800 [Prosthecomicrobium hirschii]